MRIKATFPTWRDRRKLPRYNHSSLRGKLTTRNGVNYQISKLFLQPLRLAQLLIAFGDQTEG